MYCHVLTLFEEYRGQTDHKYKRYRNCHGYYTAPRCVTTGYADRFLYDLCYPYQQVDHGTTLACCTELHEVAVVVLVVTKPDVC